MNRIQHKGIDVYILTNNEDYTPEPFAVTIKIIKKDNTYSSYAVCNSLQCSSCPLRDDCKSGNNLNAYFALKIKEIAPELFI